MKCINLYGSIKNKISIAIIVHAKLGLIYSGQSFIAGVKLEKLPTSIKIQEVAILIFTNNYLCLKAAKHSYHILYTFLSQVVCFSLTETFKIHTFDT